jgi:hypothetical protein
MRVSRSGLTLYRIFPSLVSCLRRVCLIVTVVALCASSTYLSINLFALAARPLEPAGLLPHSKADRSRGD